MKIKMESYDVHVHPIQFQLYNKESFCFQLAIGQSKSCFPKIDLSNEHDGGTNWNE